MMYICTYVHKYIFKPIGQQCAVLCHYNLMNASITECRKRPDIWSFCIYMQEACTCSRQTALCWPTATICMNAKVIKWR